MGESRTGITQIRFSHDFCDFQPQENPHGGELNKKLRMTSRGLKRQLGSHGTQRPPSHLNLPRPITRVTWFRRLFRFMVVW
jgi:hypothetical protein